LKTKVNLYWGKGNYGPEERLGLHPSTPSKFIEYKTAIEKWDTKKFSEDLTYRIF